MSGQGLSRRTAFALLEDCKLTLHGSEHIRDLSLASGTLADWRTTLDERYIVGGDQSKDRPDLVIEVIWTSGGIGASLAAAGWLISILVEEVEQFNDLDWTELEIVGVEHPSRCRRLS